ncbi:(2Fe-2S)-binding protein [Thalassomonas viridans]|uniref:(2Fe-2S)-binding protein n=1 Tax=Thalassomonas viridans TaxID=137584 RepID=A0AAE9Z6P4_9GAMM|nr:(2Fe-2S)-binding protein [Thalassomonas viridans]WDE07010.1 (2Fe-2S)-binding protein [Thalassomonas viridans]
MITFELNGEAVEVDIAADTPLLWVVRDHFKLKGSKFGCGMGLCGACSMLVDGQSIRTCNFPVAAISGRKVTTIEGLGNPERLSALQQAWVDNSVAQCGYCQSGQLISATALLNNNLNPSDSEIDEAMSGNICRCGTYPRIKKAIADVAKKAGAPSAGVNVFVPGQEG